MSDWNLSPWVAERRRDVRFAVQIAPVMPPDNPLGQFLQSGKIAEEIGLDGVFIGDHPARTIDFGIALAALALETSRISLGTLVACIQYRNPIVLARMAADLDRLSIGRMVFGLGCGWDENEYAAMGIPYLTVRQRQVALEDALQIVDGAWYHAPFTYQGTYFSAARARVTPAPLQAPRPPIIVAGGGEKVTLRQVAQYADICNLGIADALGGVRTPDDARHKFDVLRQHCERLGRPYDTILRSHHTGWLVLAETESRLQEKIDQYFPGGIEKRYSGPWREFAVARTIEGAVDYYRGLAEAGVQYFIAEILDAGDTETIRLLGEQVAPRVIGELQHR